MKTGVILLAAGSSSRLGRPKQLINYQGKTLIQHSIEAAQNSAADDLVVVLGCNSEQIQTGIESKEVSVLVRTLGGRNVFQHAVWLAIPTRN